MKKFKKNGNIILCIIKKYGKDFIGKSKLHPDDVDLRSDLVGKTIAEARAKIKLIKFKKGKLSNELISLKKHIGYLQKQYLKITQELEIEEKNLFKYIEDKNSLKEKIKKNRGEN